MITLINRFSKYSIVILGFLAITLSHAQDDRADDISILDVDANGEVDALTDGLLLLRSMFELTDDALVTGVVDSTNCKECNAEGIDSYITSIKGTTYGGLTPESGPAGPQGEKGDKGDTGPAGPQGEKGIKGDTGSQGIAGAKGDTGSQGIQGIKGDTGSQGIQGIKGDTGSQGIAGAKGDTGSQGVAGAKGDTGATGASGVAGGITDLTDALVEDNSIYIGSDPSNQTQTAENNVALGITALDSISIGDGNTAIGASADVGSGDLTNATAIGNGAIVTASNTMQLGNTSVTNVKTSGSITAGAITIPNTDGSNGQLLATDGSGQLYWLTLVPLTEAQASAITANTAKTGITSSQASAITANTAKVGISDDQVEAINQISVNTEILSSYDSAITANTAKVGMTLGTTSSTALAGDTTTITGSQASAITANTAKTVLGLGTSSTTALAGNALSGTVNIGQTGTTTTVLGTLNVDEAVTLDTTLSVTGVSTFSGATALNGDVQIGNSASDKIGFFGATAVVPSIIVNAGTLNVRDPKVYRFDDVWHVEGESVIDMRDDVVSRLDMNRAKINELIQKLQELGLIN
jgi:collagen type VII alpha